MQARSTTVDGTPNTLDKGVAYVRDRVLPAISGMDGFVGVSMLVDRLTGRSIITSAWDDGAALHASSLGVRAMRARAAQLLGGQPAVEEWEIAVLHRRRPAAPGACTRVTWTSGDPDRLGATINTLRAAMLPRIEQLPGFCSISAMVDPHSGRVTTAVTFTDRAALDRAQEEALVIRQQFIHDCELTVTGAAEFDLAVARLRVPETV